MNRREILLSSVALTVATSVRAAAKPPRPTGADIPWTTYQAAAMKTSGTIMGPAYGPFRVEMESYHQTCVKLIAPDDFAEFTVKAPANAMVVRFSLPDAPDGSGLSDTLALYRNGKKISDLALSSRFSWVYGDYPFTNNPADGKPRHFYDEVRLKGLLLRKGDKVKLVKTGQAPYCVLDFVDLEQIAPPLKRPIGALSLNNFGATGNGTDDTKALCALLAMAAKQNKIAYVPPGDYKLTGDIEVPSNVTLQGAGMWHTTFVGDETLYPESNRRLRFKLTGENSTLRDFALDGKLKYRNDSEQNDGVFGAHGNACTVSRVWIEHTKVGMWFYVCRNMRIEGCRMRNTFADGINLCVDTRDCVIENCTARNTGDDCFAIWPVPSDQGFTQESSAPGHNVIRRCTGQLPSLAQGAAIYGGDSNRIEDCLFTDITSGCGILISTSFETKNGAIDNNFRGTTLVENCVLRRCGGYDHGWTWRAALQIALHRQSISGLRIHAVRIEDSLSEGLAVIVPPQVEGARFLSDARLDQVVIRNSAIATPGRSDVAIHAGASGRLDVAHCVLGRIDNQATGFILAQQ